MSKYRIYDQHGLNFLTMTIVGWIDIFSRQRYRDIVLDSLRFCHENKGLTIFAYVIMSNHVHLVAHTGDSDLSLLLRDFKKFTANNILKAIQSEPESRREWLLYMFKYFANVNTDNRIHQFWQRSNHPIALWSKPVIWQKINYIHLNPVRAGLVAQPEHYLYSSASNYTSGKGLLDVAIMDV